MFRIELGVDPKRSTRQPRCWDLLERRGLCSDSTETAEFGVDKAKLWPQKKRLRGSVGVLLINHFLIFHFTLYRHIWSHMLSITVHPVWCVGWVEFWYFVTVAPQFLRLQSRLQKAWPLFTIASIPYLFSFLQSPHSLVLTRPFAKIRDFVTRHRTTHCIVVRFLCLTCTRTLAVQRTPAGRFYGTSKCFNSCTNSNRTGTSVGESLSCFTHPQDSTTKLATVRWEVGTVVSFLWCCFQPTFGNSWDTNGYNLFIEV